MSRFRLLALGAVLVGAVSVLSACSSAAASIPVSESTVVVDVRTAGEYTAGHLEGAVNIDLQSGEFDAEVQELDPDGEYVVYCQSGNRSAQAVTRMTALGLTDIVDAGGISAASEKTGLTIIRP